VNIAYINVLLIGFFLFSIRVDSRLNWLNSIRTTVYFGVFCKHNADDDQISMPNPEVFLLH
jgi:hypothetical protein